MPARIPSNQQRYCVFSFFKKHPTDPAVLNEKLDNCPLSTTLEVSRIIAPSDTFVNRRVKSFEKHVLYPYVDATFFSSFMDKNDLASIISQEDCMNLHEPEITMEKGIYEEVQMVDPKRDMVQTPIDEDPYLHVALSRNLAEEECERKYKGFIINAYKSMEHMDSEDFIRNWKTWTGVRYICTQLPRQLALRRISFYRLINETTPFKYVLVIELSNVGLYVPHTLNLLDRLKLKLCGHIGIYRNQDFTIDPISAKVFGKGTKEDTPPDPKSPEVQVPLPGEKLLTLSQSGKASISKVIGERKEIIKQFDINSDNESEVNVFGEPLESPIVEKMNRGKTPLDRHLGEGAGKRSATRHYSIPIISPREKAREKQLIAREASPNRKGASNVEVQIHAPRAMIEDEMDIGDVAQGRKRSPIAAIASKIKSPNRTGNSLFQRRSPTPRNASNNLDESGNRSHEAKTLPNMHPRLLVNDRSVGITGNVYVTLPMPTQQPRDY